MSEIIVQEDVLKIVQNLKERFANCHFWDAGTREMFDKQLPILKVVKANFQTKYSLLMILFLNMSFSFIHVCFHHLLKLRFWKSFKMYLLMFSCLFFYNARWKHLHARTKKTCFGWFSTAAHTDRASTKHRPQVTVRWLRGGTLKGILISEMSINLQSHAWGGHDMGLAPGTDLAARHCGAVWAWNWSIRSTGGNSKLEVNERWAVRKRFVISIQVKRQSQCHVISQINVKLRQPWTRLASFPPSCPHCFVILGTKNANDFRAFSKFKSSPFTISRAWRSTSK